MRRTEYVKRMKELLRDREKSPRRAAVGFLRLSRLARARAKSGVGLWDVEQALGFAAASYKEAGEHRRAERVERVLAREYRLQIKYHECALAYSLARIAIACLKAGREKEGVKLGFEALGYFAKHGEAPVILQNLVTELRGYGLIKKTPKTRGL